ncbi:MAG: hypothetical protein KJO88_09285 [Gammaproteobacteria bacterium]|nr:hypothetical protein [Gammaproteobacteria bacterium]
MKINLICLCCMSLLLCACQTARQVANAPGQAATQTASQTASQTVGQVAGPRAGQTAGQAAGQASAQVVSLEKPRNNTLQASSLPIAQESVHSSKNLQ